METTSGHDVDSTWIQRNCACWEGVNKYTPNNSGDICTTRINIIYVFNIWAKCKKYTLLSINVKNIHYYSFGGTLCPASFDHKILFNVMTIIVCSCHNVKSSGLIYHNICSSYLCFYNTIITLSAYQPRCSYFVRQ